MRKKTAALCLGIGISAVLLFVIGCLIFAAISFNRINVELKKHDSQSRIDSLKLPKVQGKTSYNVLVMGIDKRKNDKLYRADSFMVLRVSPAQHAVWALSIPRDINCSVAGAGMLKLSESYSWGQELEVVKQVENLTHQKINHVVVLNFSGFKKLVNNIGGVRVNVPIDINDSKADYTSNKHASIIKKGTQILDGAHALTFVRSRNYQDGDFSRMGNQRLLFKAVAQKMQSMPAKEVFSAVTVASHYIDTDMDFKALFQLAYCVKQASPQSIYVGSLSGRWEAPYVVLNNRENTIILSQFSKGVPFKTN